jgi:hypothetical protein
MEAAEVQACIDALGDIPKTLNDTSGKRLAELYAGLDLRVLHEPDTSIAEVSMRANCACPRPEWHIIHPSSGQVVRWRRVIAMIGDESTRSNFRRAERQRRLDGTVHLGLRVEHDRECG